MRVPAERLSFINILFNELSDPASGAAAIVRQSLLTLIINEVTRAAAWSIEDGSERSIVTQSLRYIERHCLEPLTLKTVAAAMHRTPAYITTALTRATGRSAVAWIIAGRMAEARRRLLHSDERIDIVAERVGYGDVTHFIRVFRRTHGETPAAWRVAQQRVLSTLARRCSAEPPTGANDWRTAAVKRARGRRDQPRPAPCVTRSASRVDALHRRRERRRIHLNVASLGIERQLERCERARSDAGRGRTKSASRSSDSPSANSMRSENPTRPDPFAPSRRCG